MSKSSGRPGRAQQLRRAFLQQARYSERHGSSFTGLLCRVLADGFDGSSEAEGAILKSSGDAGPFGDSVPLRVTGALHYLVRSGRAPELARLYPPHRMPDPGTLRRSVRRALRQQGEFLGEFLRLPPQTNEVGRSAVLMGGLLEIAQRTQFPLSLFEIGASAGLNLIADRYAYRFGRVKWGPQARSAAAINARLRNVTISCDWKGRPPAVNAPFIVQSRRGCDRHPLDVSDPVQRERLLAYVWADQRDRLSRLSAAMELMSTDPVIVEAGDAAEWLPAALPRTSDAGVVRVVFHSFLWNYLDGVTKTRIAAHMSETGAVATSERPLAWLRLEFAAEGSPAGLSLTSWPDGQDELLAHAHPHGAWVRWRN